MPERPPQHSTQTCPDCWCSGVVLYWPDTDRYSCTNCLYRWEADQ